MNNILGLLSPNRTIRTSYEARQERKNSISRLPSTEETELPTALDLHPSAVSIFLFIQGYEFLLIFASSF